MTKRQLIINLAAVGVVILALLALALASRYLHDFFKDFATWIAVIAGAYIAYCFQARHNFLAALREIWKTCVHAKGDLIDYATNAEPKEAIYRHATRSISEAIDMMRSVYGNVGQSKDEIGFYPYEPLHDMRKALKEIGFSNVTPASRENFNAKIETAWNSLRAAFLPEMGLPVPTDPVIERGSADLRRSSPETTESSIGKPIKDTR